MAAELLAAFTANGFARGNEGKEVNGMPLVIEINDNPNIDVGVEDRYYGDKIYTDILMAFKNRLERKEL